MLQCVIESNRFFPKMVTPKGNKQLTLSRWMKRSDFCRSITLFFVFTWFIVAVVWLLTFQFRDKQAYKWDSSTVGDDQRTILPRRPLANNTLIVYVFSGSDPEYIINLRFFIMHAVKVVAHLS